MKKTRVAREKHPAVGPEVVDMRKEKCVCRKQFSERECNDCRKIDGDFPRPTRKWKEEKTSREQVQQIDEERIVNSGQSKPLWGKIVGLKGNRMRKEEKEKKDKGKQ